MKIKTITVWRCGPVELNELEGGKKINKGGGGVKSSSWNSWEHFVEKCSGEGFVLIFGKEGHFVNFSQMKWPQFYFIFVGVFLQKNKIK